MKIIIFDIRYFIIILSKQQDESLILKFFDNVHKFIFLS
jgi:hypothetical protein